MKQTLEVVKAKLKEASMTRSAAVRGCCTVIFNGSKIKQSNVTEKDCDEIAQDLPGATYDFQPGVNCA